MSAPLCTVYSGAFTSDPNATAALRFSCARHSVPLTLFGQNRPWPHDAIFPELIALAQRSPTPYVLFTDAYDVLCNRWDEKELAQLIDAAPGHRIQACESSCWPSGPWEQAAYPPHKRLSPWFAANGGQVCGRKDAVAELFRVNYYSYATTAGGGNQERLHKMIADGFEVGLDQKCEVFQSMLGAAAKYVVPAESVRTIAWNSVTGSVPMFLHFNGRAPGMDEWAQRLGLGQAGVEL